MDTNDQPVVIVTGGSTHVGRAIAEELARTGYLVYIASRNGDRCKRVAEEVSRHHGDCRGATVDVTQPSSVNDLLTQVMEEAGRLDALVANAGGRVDSEEAASPQNARAVIELNLLGALNTATAVCPVLAESGGGAAVLVSSVHGLLGSDARLYDGIPSFTPSAAAYHSAKGGVIQLARSLAAEWGPAGVRINAVSPGVIAGPNIPRPLADRVAERTPLGRVGTAEEVATVVPFLLGSESAWITGQNIVADGGWSIW